MHLYLCSTKIIALYNDPKITVIAIPYNPVYSCTGTKSLAKAIVSRIV